MRGGRSFSAASTDRFDGLISLRPTQWPTDRRSCQAMVIHSPSRSGSAERTRPSFTRSFEDHIVAEQDFVALHAFFVAHRITFASGKGCGGLLPSMQLWGSSERLAPLFFAQCVYEQYMQRPGLSCSHWRTHAGRRLTRKRQRRAAAQRRRLSITEVALPRAAETLCRLDSRALLSQAPRPAFRGPSVCARKISQRSDCVLRHAWNSTSSFVLTVASILRRQCLTGHR